MSLSNFILLILPALVSVAFYTLMERKVLGFSGNRVGPMKVSMLGILQPIGDAVKLSNKQENILYNMTFNFYYLSSGVFLSSSLCLWYVSFVDPLVVVFKFSIIIMMIILSLNSLNSIIIGWSSFGKYSLMGSMRSVSQLVSYEGSLFMCLLFPIFLYQNFSSMVVSCDQVYVFFLFIPMLLYFWLPSMLADLNRTPYDFSEGESELVSGFNVDFGSAGFTFIFLAEYSNILFFCLFSTFMFSGIMIFFYFFLFFFFVIWVRSVLPRYRFDMLMMICWKMFIPFMTSFLILFFLYLTF